MATLEFTNVDFTNAKNDATRLLRAHEDTATVVKKGVRKISAPTKEEIMKDLAQDVKDILQSPLTKPQASGYGALPMEAVQPIRRLYAMVRSLAQSEDGKVAPDEEVLDDLRGRVLDFVTSVDPNHSFVKLLGKDASDEDDEDDDKNGEGVEKQVTSVTSIGDGGENTGKGEGPAKAQSAQPKQNSTHQPPKQLSAKAQGKLPASQGKPSSTQKARQGPTKTNGKEGVGQVKSSKQKRSERRSGRIAAREPQQYSEFYAMDEEDDLLSCGDEDEYESDAT